METKEIKINKDKLRETIENALKQAHNFDMSGWRLPIFVEDNGKLEIGSWMSQGSWQPGANEVYSINSWEVDQWFNSEGEEVAEEALSEEEREEYIDDYIDGLIDFHMERIEGVIDEHNAQTEMRIDEVNYGKELGYNLPDVTFVQYELVD